MKKLIFAAMVALVSMSSGAVHAQFWGDNPMESYNRSGGSYARGEALRSGDVMEATVVAVRPVQLEASATADTTGKAVGGALGALAGSKMGKGNGQYAGAIIGGLIGAIAGQETARKVSESGAAEVIIRFADGRTKFVVQEDGGQFRPGDRVYVMSGSGWNASIRLTMAQ